MEVSAGRPQERRRLQQVVCAVGLLVIGIMGCAVPIASSQTGTEHPKSSKPPTILFMCPHGAAKSVLASAYFRRLAKERGAERSCRISWHRAGRDSLLRCSHPLKGQGYSIPIAKPRKVAPEEFGAADVVISIGCDLAALPQPRGKLVRWNEVPPLSDDFTAADEAIREARHTRYPDKVESERALYITGGFATLPNR